MSFLNTNDIDVNVNIDEVFQVQDGTVTKEKLAKDVQKKIYDPYVVTSNGADLAEVGFWVDNNPENEDRLYRFVSIAGEKGREIKIADSNDQIAGTSNIIDNVGFLGNYTEGDENDNKKVIVSIVGVVPVRTNDNTIKANDRVMSDNNGYAVKSTNNCGYRVLEVIKEGLLNIVVSPNTDMIQHIKTDMLENEEILYIIKQEVYNLRDDKQDTLIAGDNIIINENNVISATKGRDSQANIDVMPVKSSNGQQFLEITVTDKDGNENVILTDNINGTNGKDGKDGKDGKNGVSGVTYDIISPDDTENSLQIVLNKYIQDIGWIYTSKEHRLYLTANQNGTYSYSRGTSQSFELNKGDILSVAVDVIIDVDSFLINTITFEKIESVFATKNYVDNQIALAIANVDTTITEIENLIGEVTVNE